MRGTDTDGKILTLLDIDVNHHGVQLNTIFVEPKHVVGVCYNLVGGSKAGLVVVILAAVVLHAVIGEQTTSTGDVRISITFLIGSIGVAGLVEGHLLPEQAGNFVESGL